MSTVVVCIAQRKEAIAQWNLIKHEKVQYLKFLKELCEIDEDGEYNLNHKFSKSKAESDEKCIEQIISIILDRQNPLMLGAQVEESSNV